MGYSEDALTNYHPDNFYSRWSCMEAYEVNVNNLAAGLNTDGKREKNLQDRLIEEFSIDKRKAAAFIFRKEGHPYIGKKIRRIWEAESSGTKKKKSKKRSKDSEEEKSTEVRTYTDAVIVGWLPADENEGVELWHLEHDDGDEEDLEEHEVMEGMKLINEASLLSPNGSTTTLLRPAPGRHGNLKQIVEKRRSEHKNYSNSNSLFKSMDTNIGIESFANYLLTQEENLFPYLKRTKKLDWGSFSSTDNDDSILDDMQIDLSRSTGSNTSNSANDINTNSSTSIIISSEKLKCSRQAWIKCVEGTKSFHQLAQCVLVLEELIHSLQEEADHDEEEEERVKKQQEENAKIMKKRKKLEGERVRFVDINAKQYRDGIILTMNPEDFNLFVVKRPLTFQSVEEEKAKNAKKEESDEMEEEEEELEAVLEKVECEEAEISYEEIKKSLRYYRTDYLPGDKEEEQDVDEEEDEGDEEEHEGSMMDEEEEEEETKATNGKSIGEKNSKKQASEATDGEKPKTLWVGKADRNRFINAVLSSNSFTYLAMNLELLWDKAALFGVFSNVSSSKKSKGKSRR